MGSPPASPPPPRRAPRDVLTGPPRPAGFEDYVEPLKLYLHKYREAEEKGNKDK